MKSFTYYDYIKCIHTLRLNAVFRLAEEGNEYNLGTKEKTEEDFLLGNKEEVSKLINTFLSPNKKILSNDLIKYKNKNIERKYRKNPIKAIYKIRNEEKYYLNPDFDNLPDHIKDELKIMCVLYVHDVGGILTLVYEEDGSLCFEVTSEEGDPMFDDIGSALKIKELQRTKEELLQSLQLYYRVFFMGEDLEEQEDQEENV